MSIALPKTVDLTTELPRMKPNAGSLPMTQDGSVTHWFQLLQEGDHEAAQPLWDRYFSRLKGLANKMLQGRGGATADAEDVALSVFDAMSRGLQHGRFPKLSDRDNLWRLLVVITARKVSHLLRDEQSQKRGGGENGVCRMTVDPGELEQVIGEEPTPDFLAEATEEFQRLLQKLQDETLVKIAVWKMEGYTNREIAGLADCALKTVDRKLRLIRHIWEDEVMP